MKKIKSIMFVPLICGLLTGCGGEKVTGSREITAWINEGNDIPMSKDQIWKKIEEETNVTLSISGATHGKTYYDSLGTKLNTLKNVPDIFFSVPSDVNCAYTTWVQNDLVWNYDELLLDKPGQYPHIEKILHSDTYKNIIYGDNLHTLLPYLTSRSGWTIYYRGDWLIKTGFYEEVGGEKIAKVPTTMDEFEAVLKAFRDNDPDNNGKKDTYGLSPAAPLYFMNPLYHAFGVSPDYDIDSSNNVTYMYTQPEFREFVKWANRMYTGGYIEPNYTTNAVNKGDRDNFYNGLSGILITNGEDHVSYITTESAKQRHFDIVVGPAPVGTATLGKEGCGGFSDWGGYWGGYSIYKDYKNGQPDKEKAYACLDLLDYLYSEEGGLLRSHGIQGVHWDYNDKGEIVPNLVNRNEEIYEIFYEVGGQYNGFYKMGRCWGNRVHWDNDEFGVVIENHNVGASDKALFKQTVDICTITSSKLVNFTAYTTGFTSKINSFQNEMNQYGNDCIKGTSNIDNWSQELNRLNSSFSWAEIQQAIKDQARKAGIIS